MSPDQHASLGPQVQIDPTVRIGRGCVLDGEVIVGAGAQLDAGVLVQGPCVLSAEVRLSAGVRVVGQPGHAGWQSNVASGTLAPTTGLLIGPGACVEAGALLTGTIEVGAGAVVRAGAVVTQSVPPHAVVAGSPARIVGYTNSGEPLQATASLLARELLGNTGSAVQALDVVSQPPGQPALAVQLHRLKRVQDMRGDLSVGEFADDIPFSPQRYFLVYNVPSEHTRGAHAHRACHQFLICVAGSCSVVVDDGQRRAEVVLDAPHLGLYMPPMIWGIQYNYSPGAVLLVYASHRYDPDDYIREYDQFSAEISAENEQYSSPTLKRGE